MQRQRKPLLHPQPRHHNKELIRVLSPKERFRMFRKAPEIPSKAKSALPSESVWMQPGMLLTPDSPRPAQASILRTRHSSPRVAGSSNLRKPTVSRRRAHGFWNTSSVALG